MEPSNLRLLRLGQHTLAVRAFNETQPGTPLVFIHGITSSVNFWARGQTDLVAARRWYSLSLPGHYPSQFAPGFTPDQLTPELMADLTAEAICQLVGDQPVILVGHSTGGFTTLAVAARHPERVKAAVCVSGFALGYWTGALRLLQREARLGGIGHRVFKLSLRGMTSAFAVYKASLRFYTADHHAVYRYPGLDAVLHDQYPDAVRLDLDAMIAFFSRMPDIDITGWLPRIQAPLLVLAGDADRIVPPEQARIIAQSVPGSTLHLFQGAGHLPMVERRAEYHRIVTAWIGQQL